MATRIKAKAAAAAVPQSKAEVAQAIRRLGDTNREFERVRTTMNDLIGFLTRNCCGGDASRCAPARQASASKAAPVKKVAVKKAIRT